MLLPLLGVIVLGKVLAWDATPANGKLLVIDDAFLTVSAYDASTGKRAWTSKVIQEAKGRHTLHVAGGEVLAWFGETLSSLDPATGTVRALGKRGYNGVRWEDGGCWIDLAEGAAAQRCQCSFQVFDPRTNKDLGPRYEKTYIEYHEPDANGGHAGRSAGCWGMSEQLFGVAGSLALISTEDSVVARGKGKPRGDTITAAIDVVKGTEVWRIPQRSQFGGHSPDGKTCWFWGFTEEVVAVDCATGKKLWSGTALPVMGRHVATFVPGPRGGVFVLRAPTGRPAIATLHDERTGAVRWTTKLAPDTLAWVRGTTLPLVTSADDAAAVAILDPKTGKPLVTVQKRNAEIALDGRGGFVIHDDKDAVAYSAEGKETGRLRLAVGGLVFGDALVAATTETELVILERGTLRERGRVSGTFGTVHVEGGLGAGHVAAFAYDGKTIGSVTLVDVR